MRIAVSGRKCKLNFAKMATFGWPDVAEGARVADLAIVLVAAIWAKWFALADHS